MSSNGKGLQGKKGVVLGSPTSTASPTVAPRPFRALGAELAISYLNEKARPYVEPLAAELEASIFLPLDVQDPRADERFLQDRRQTWGTLDFALHSIAYAPKADLHGRVTDCSREGFLLAMDVSCHSFIRMVRLAEPLMKNGGTFFTMSYYGAEKVVKNYNMMGPVKAALEATVRSMAAELGPAGIRVHAISPGPLKTRAASGIAGFDDLMEKAAAEAPTRSLVSIEDVGFATAGLATDNARLITGGTIHVDGGLHIIG